MSFPLPAKAGAYLAHTQNVGYPVNSCFQYSVDRRTELRIIVAVKHWGRNSEFFLCLALARKFSHLVKASCNLRGCFSWEFGADCKKIDAPANNSYKIGNMPAGQHFSSLDSCQYQKKGKLARAAVVYCCTVLQCLSCLHF